MNDAVIGCTGFVGGHLQLQHKFEGRFNTRTIQEAAGQEFDTAVCAAAPGSMFEANRFPDRDGERINALIGQLSKIRAQRFVLISSIAVLADFAGRDNEQTLTFATKLAYGVNRRRLEVFCQDRFPSCLIVRLPALFGSGLKKNFLFDLINPMPSMLAQSPYTKLHDGLSPELRAGLSGFYSWSDDLNLFVMDRDAFAAIGRRAAYEEAVAQLGLSAVGFTNPNSSFQYYDIVRLWRDIQVCFDSGIDLIHLVTEPLRAGDIFATLMGRPMAETGARLHREDMWTMHAALFGGEAPYIAGVDAVMKRLTRFFAEESARV